MVQQARQAPTNREEELSQFVKVSNLPEKFFKGHFVSDLNDECNKLLPVGEPLDPIISCSDKDIVEKTVVLEFRTAYIAQVVCTVHNITYAGKKLILTQQHTTNYENSASEAVDIGVLNNDPAEADSPSSSSGLLPRGVVFRTDWPTYETLKLLEICIKEKEYLRSSSTRKKGEGYRKVYNHMMSEKLYYSLNTLKKHLKGLTTAYIPGATTDFNPYIAEYFGEAPPGSSNICEALKTCDRSIPVLQKKSAKNNKYIHGILVTEDALIEDNGDKFTFESDKLLIAEYKSRKAFFDDDIHRASEVYIKILSVMREHGYNHLSVLDLSKRMAYLADQYKKRFDAVLNHTGTSSDAQKWPYYDPMGQILENSVVCKPQKIVSVGTVNSCTVRNVSKKPTGSTSSGLSPTESYKSMKLGIGESVVKEMKGIKDIVSNMFAKRSL